MDGYRYAAYPSLPTLSLDFSLRWESAAGGVD